METETKTETKAETKTETKVNFQQPSFSGTIIKAN